MWVARWGLGRWSLGLHCLVLYDGDCALSTVYFRALGARAPLANSRPVGLAGVQT